MRTTVSIDNLLRNPTTARADQLLAGRISYVRQLLKEADGVLIGAGAGLSTAAGIRYDGDDFRREFRPWIDRYGITDLYSSGFYPFATEEEYWACWARHIWFCRYRPDGLPLYRTLLRLVDDKDYFVFTTNVDAQFQKSGFAADRIFACQGDYGLFQTESGRTKKLYPNEQMVNRMMAATTHCRIPTALIPRDAATGEKLVPNLRVDDRFVEDDHWHRQADRYRQFVEHHRKGRLVLLELGVGFNTPGIIRYPFEQMATSYPHTALVRFNQQPMPLIAGISDLTVFGDCEELYRLVR
jgi:NAD-dependent SIR2 family protein deacetylase